MAIQISLLLKNISRVVQIQLFSVILAYQIKLLFL